MNELTTEAFNEILGAALDALKRMDNAQVLRELRIERCALVTTHIVDPMKPLLDDTLVGLASMTCGLLDFSLADNPDQPWSAETRNSMRVLVYLILEKASFLSSFCLTYCAFEEHFGNEFCNVLLYPNASNHLYRIDILGQPSWFNDSYKCQAWASVFARSSPLSHLDLRDSRVPYSDQ